MVGEMDRPGNRFETREQRDRQRPRDEMKENPPRTSARKHCSRHKQQKNEEYGAEQQ